MKRDQEILELTKQVLKSKRLVLGRIYVAIRDNIVTMTEYDRLPSTKNKNVDMMGSCFSRRS